jgi:RNA polymerase sigma-70 factor, ECF subfamily
VGAGFSPTQGSVRLDLPETPMTSLRDITGMLIDWGNGDKNAVDILMPLLESELRRLARSHIRRFRPDSVLQTTALINDAYLRLIDQNRVKWQNRAHFFCIAAKMMRRVLLNHVRDQNRLKRGGGAIHVSLEGVAVISRERSADLLLLDEALRGLQRLDERKASVVELRCYGGLSNDEIAEALGTSRATVIRDWKFAKAWLRREMLRE